MIHKDFKHTWEINQIQYNIKSHSFRINTITKLLQNTSVQDAADIIGYKDIKSIMAYKRYVLNSEGTLFADSAGTIGINEYGAYVQATKNLFDNFLKLTVSGRYDKNQNFKGRFTPRVTALIRIAENNNIRLIIGV